MPQRIDDIDWQNAQNQMDALYRNAGIPEDMWPDIPIRHGNKQSDLAQYIARARAGLQNARFRALRAGRLQDPNAPGDEPMPEWRQNILMQQAIQAQRDAALANQKAQETRGGVLQSMWNALGQNPALYQQMMSQMMGPMADYFWNKFPAHFDRLTDIYGQQLNTNAERTQAMTIARGEDAGKTSRLEIAMAGLKDIYSGLSGALQGGLGSIGKGMGQWGAGYSPIGGASGAFGAGGGGGWRILPNGSVVTAQDVPGGIPTPGAIRGGEVNLGPIAGVNTAAANELAEAGRGAGRQAAGRIRGKFNADAARQQMGAQSALMAAGAKQNLGQLGNALLVAKGINRNIERDAQSKALVQKAHNQALALRQKQFGGLAGQLGGLVGNIGNIG